MKEIFIELQELNNTIELLTTQRDKAVAELAIANEKLINTIELDLANETFDGMKQTEKTLSHRNNILQRQNHTLHMVIKELQEQLEDK